MVELLILPLVCYGFCKILIEGSIFDSVRNWFIEKEVNSKSKTLKIILSKFNQLISCYLCLGFHIGWFVGLFYGPFPAWNILFNGLFYSAVVWIIHSVIQFLGNGNDPNRSIILQIPDTITLKEESKDIKE